MVKTPPKAKKAGDAIVPVAKKPRQKREVVEDQRGAIVKLIMTHEKLAAYRQFVPGWLPPHGKPLTESDLKGVQAILDSDLAPLHAWEAFKGFFGQGSTTKRK
jgi:hypothetical protein